jgi:hypothetical protein
MSDPNDSTSTDDGIPLSLTFLEFCAKVRKDDPSILPEVGKPVKIRSIYEREGIELSDALLENKSVTYLELETEDYTKKSAEAMVKYLRTSECLQRISWHVIAYPRDELLKQHEEMFCCFLPAFQESSLLKELNMRFPLTGGPSYLALEIMLTHTQSLLSLSLSCPTALGDIAVAAACSGLKNNSTLRELTLKVPRDAANVSPILTSLCDHPFLERLRLCGDAMDLTELETVLLSDNSQITELDMHSLGHPPIMGLTRVMRALARYPPLTKLGIRDVRLDRDELRLLQMAWCNIPSLQSLDLANSKLGSAGLAELAPAFYESARHIIERFERYGVRYNTSGHSSQQQDRDHP